jgi:hypothetical protein
VKRRKWSPSWRASSPSGITTCDPSYRQAWQPTVEQVKLGLDWFTSVMLPTFSVVTDQEELEAMRSLTSQILAGDDEMYLVTALGIGDVIGLNVFAEQHDKCELCARNVGLLVVRVAEREGLISIIDRGDSEGPGQPLSMVARVGGLVERVERPIVDHGAWFASHNERTQELTALVCERCMFAPGARS